MPPARPNGHGTASNPPPISREPRSSSRKRKTISYTENDKDEHAEAASYKIPIKKPKTRAAPSSTTTSTNSKSKKRAKDAPSSSDVTVVAEEKRLRRYRTHAPESYLIIKSRALTQRLTVMSRTRCGTPSVPEEKVVIAGSTGNLYTVHINHVPSCNCPHARKGNQCKHVVYVMLRLLKALEHLSYQLALTTSELQSLFASAPPIPSAPSASASDAAQDTNRKPITGECPICYTDFSPATEEIMYCKDGCGNNVHRECMVSWMAACRGRATCPYCRAVWVDEEIGGAVDVRGGVRNEEGYVNVAAQLGLSGERDYSSYYQPWARRRYRRGWYD